MRLSRLSTFVLLFLLSRSQAEGALPEAKPTDLGLDPARLARVDEAIEAAIKAKQVPGAAVLIARHGKVAHI